MGAFEMKSLSIIFALACLILALPSLGQNLCVTALDNLRLVSPKDFKWLPLESKPLYTGKEEAVDSIIAGFRGRRPYINRHINKGVKDTLLQAVKVKDANYDDLLFIDLIAQVIYTLDLQLKPHIKKSEVKQIVRQEMAWFRQFELQPEIRFEMHVPSIVESIENLHRGVFVFDLSSHMDNLANFKKQFASYHNFLNRLLSREEMAQGKAYAEINPVVKKKALRTLTLSFGIFKSILIKASSLDAEVQTEVLNALYEHIFENGNVLENLSAEQFGQKFAHIGTERAKKFLRSELVLK